MPALIKGHQQEKPQPQQQKRQQQQDLCGKTIMKVAGNEARNMGVNVVASVIKKKCGGRVMYPSGRGFCYEWQ
jgi:hypothetical protein